MALTELWLSAPQQLKDKSVYQIISFAGGGRLLDGNDTSKEFREFLSAVPSTYLQRYSDQCLTTRFDGGGFALQDVVNEIGRRLGFAVIDGRYRGTRNEIGFDGLWSSPDGHDTIVEVKTTDAYRIDLDTIAAYRRGLIQTNRVSETQSSLLIVCGREDTGDLEAQVRGSRHAWDIRMISVDALQRLLAVKEELDNPATVRKIREILQPHEFTKVDGIIDIVFSTAEDVRQAEDEVQMDDTVEQDSEGATFYSGAAPSKFNDACVLRVQKHLACVLVKRSQTTYATPQNDTVVVCAVSREHHDREEGNYWFAVHPHQKQAMDAVTRGFLAFGCGSDATVVLVPGEAFQRWLEGMNVTNREDRFYWHVSIFRGKGRLTLHRRRGYPVIDLMEFVLSTEEPPAGLSEDST